MMINYSAKTYHCILIFIMLDDVNKYLWNLQGRYR